MATARWGEGGGRAAPGGARAPGEEDERGGGEMGIEEMGFGREDSGGAREDAREWEMGIEGEG